MMAASAIRAQTDAKMIRPSSSGMWAKKMQAAMKAMNRKIIADYCCTSQNLSHGNQAYGRAYCSLKA